MTYDTCIENTSNTNLKTFLRKNYKFCIETKKQIYHNYDAMKKQSNSIFFGPTERQKYTEKIVSKLNTLADWVPAKMVIVFFAR